MNGRLKDITALPDFPIWYRGVGFRIYKHHYHRECHETGSNFSIE